MRNTLLFTFKTLFILSIAFEVNAIVAIRPNLRAGIKNGEDCGMRSSQGSTSQIAELSGLLHKAAWYEDRDNSMEDANDEIGDSMVFASGNGTYTLGIKLSCPKHPNAYIITGHGLIDREGNNALRYLDPFPISDNNYADDFTKSKVVSPWLGRPRAQNISQRIGKDYAIVLVDGDSDLQHSAPGVRPIEGNNQEIIEAENNGKMNVSLYRGKTRYQTNSDGRPLADSTGSFQEQGLAITYEDTIPVYDVPQKVTQSCSLTRGSLSSYIGHDCPSEQSVSGSLLVADVNGENLLLGIHASGDSRYKSNIDSDDTPNSFVPSSAFCDDYESICGQPCVDLDEVLPQDGDGVSI